MTQLRPPGASLPRASPGGVSDEYALWDAAYAGSPSELSGMPALLA
jgi:hypothetical protein